MSILIAMTIPKANEPFLVVLGVAQDGGVPHAGCDKDCCKNAWEHENVNKKEAYS